MKRIAMIAALTIAAAGAVSAQTLHIEKSSVIYSFPATSTGHMNFSQDNYLEIFNCRLPLQVGTSMWVDDAAVSDNTVVVKYDGETAKVDISGNIAQYVTATVQGAHVSIVQSDEVGDESCGEITYELSGISADGAFSLTGSYKSTIELRGLTLTNPTGAAIDIQNGKRIEFSIKNGTVNSLTDGASGSQKGCIVCKGHLELKGKGELTVVGNKSHAIYSKEYIEMKNCTIKVEKSQKDGINCNQYFSMESGTLILSGVADDGIQVAYKDATDREAEDTGAVTITGGNINITVTADAAKGIKCEGPMQINGGEITIIVSGNGVWDADNNKTKASACLASDTDMKIAGGTLTLTATGGGGKGINCDGNLEITDGTIDIKTSGGVVAYVNGVLNNNYTGNTDRIASNMKSSPKGVKTDGNVTISGGNITVKVTGNGGEGIESKKILTISNGNINVQSTDDAINSASHMYIQGGTITVIASGNDGLDSNGNLYIQGGYIMAFGGKSPECGIDAAEENGYTVVFTGGTLLAVGGNNSVPSTSSGSTQAYVTSSGTLTANTKVTLSDSSGNELATFTVPQGYASSAPALGPGGGGGWGGSSGGILVTCGGLQKGTSYKLALGSTTSNVTAK